MDYKAKYSQKLEVICLNLSSTKELLAANTEIVSLRQLLKERDTLLVTAYKRIEYLEQTLQDIADLKTTYLHLSQLDAEHAIQKPTASAPEQPLQQSSHQSIEKKPLKTLSFKKIASSTAKPLAQIPKQTPLQTNQSVPQVNRSLKRPFEDSPETKDETRPMMPAPIIAPEIEKHLQEPQNLLSHINPSELMSWKAIAKIYRPKGSMSALSSQAKDRLNESVFEFLNGKVEPDLIPLCVVEEKNATLAAVPESLDNMIAAGMLLKENLKNRASGMNIPKTEVPGQAASLLSWKDVVEKAFPEQFQEIMEEPRDYGKRVLVGIGSFLKEHAKEIQNRSVKDCWIQNPGETSRTLAIPVELEKTFLAWFGEHLNSCFYQFDARATLE